MTPSAPTFPTQSAELASGATMPLLGFGTWQITGPAAATATRTALDTGYRHIDTATLYGNEREVGEAVVASGVARDELFITTKMPPDRDGEARQVLEESLRLLGTDYVDLWLIHWTPSDGLGLGAWREFVRAQSDGLARDIGVSNYSVAQIDALAEETGVRPTVNQIRWSPLLFDATVQREHRERGVVLEGYSALRGGTLENPVIGGIAERLGRTPAQVILRWHLQHDVVAIPKSVSEERIAANADLGGFELTDDDMAALDALGGTES